SLWAAGVGTVGHPCRQRGDLYSTAGRCGWTSAWAQMSDIARDRLFGVGNAFDHPVVLWVSIALVALLIAAPVAAVLLRRTGRIDDAHFRELLLRCLSWMVLAPLMIGPVLLGAAWFIGFVFVIMLLCYREFVRATGLFRERTLSGVVLLAITALGF